MPLFRQESAAELRRRADALVGQGRYAEAADCYRKEAAIYRSKGDINGAIVEEAKADRYTSTVRLYVHLPGDPPGAGPQTGPLAKHEPAYGCYIGAFLDRDDQLGRGFMFNDQIHKDPTDFARITGKKLASVFCYLNWGRPFPNGWVEKLRNQGVAPHIAWEPNQGLQVVQDDAYLTQFAQQAGRAGCPIFLRYASEMNGDWVRYGGNPEEYKRKWILVQKRFAQYAPNVAMIWCANHIPEVPIPLYYPGDEYVDWVGVNFYSVPFYDNLPSRPGLADNPADRLRAIYRLYAAKKPIAICEFGASHFSTADNTERSDWAVRKIAELYSALPRLYPRVKLIDIFDNNNLKYAEAGRQLNNYCVTDTDVVRTGYSRAVAPDYFLSDVASDFRATPVVPMKDGLKVPRGMLKVSSLARCYAENFTVLYELDGQKVAADAEPGPRETLLRLTTAGTRVLTATVLDEKSRVATKTTVKLIVS